jgi:putative FmdB family regulatory protein
MARYDYHCTSCKETTEIQHPMADAPKTTCPRCGAETLQRQIGTTSFVLKGSGWFKSGGY